MAGIANVGSTNGAAQATTGSTASADSKIAEQFKKGASQVFMGMLKKMLDEARTNSSTEA